VRAALALLRQGGTRRRQRTPGHHRWVSWPRRCCVWNPTARSPRRPYGNPQTTPADAASLVVFTV
jgi:hypothetical protein